jgi:hypothetical protein
MPESGIGALWSWSLAGRPPNGPCGMTRPTGIVLAAYESPIPLKSFPFSRQVSQPATRPSEVI